MTLPTLTVVTDGADWEAALVAAWSSSGSGVTVVRRCTGAADLLAMAATGIAVAAVLPADLAHLDRPLLTRLASAGVAVVGIVDPDDDASHARLRSLGIGHVLPAHAAPAAVAAALRAAVAAVGAHRGSPRASGSAAPGASRHSGPLAPGRWPTRAAPPTAPSIARSRLSGRSAARRPGPDSRDLADPATPDRLAMPSADAGLPGDPPSPGGFVPADTVLAQPPGTEGAPDAPGDGPARRSGDGLESLGAGADRAAWGRVIAVWGPTGAPGRTTVAVGLADEAARLGVATLLVDADTYGGVVAQFLGLLDEASGLASAARLADTGRLTPRTLAALARAITPDLRVLTGLSRSERWPEVGPEAMSDILDQARALCALTVVDCGFCLDQDEELVYDTAAPRRNGATLTALEAADTVLAVGSCDPVGLQRLIRGLASLKEIAPSVEPEVVVNRLRRGPIPGEPTRQVATALERFAGVRGIRTLPYDRAALDGALAEGRTLAEVAEKSRLRRAFIELATSVSVQFGLRGSTGE